MMKPCTSPHPESKALCNRKSLPYRGDAEPSQAEPGSSTIVEVAGEERQPGPANCTLLRLDDLRRRLRLFLDCLRILFSNFIDATTDGGDPTIERDERATG